MGDFVMRELDFFHKATSYLHSSLVSAQDVNKVISFINLLPSKPFARRFYLECSLLGNPKCLDLTFDIPPASALLEKNGMTFTDFFSQMHGGAHQIWKRFAHFLDVWKGDLPVHCVELDIGSSSEWPPLPNLFFYRVQPQGNLLSSLIGEALVLLTDYPFPFRIKDRLQEYLDLCCVSTHKVTCGLMMARVLEGVRVGHKVSDLDVCKVLMKAGYASDLQPLQLLLKKITPHITDIVLAVDIGETIGQRIGIECYAKDEQWAPFLSCLFAESLTTLEIKEACVNWMGYEVEAENTDDISFFIRKINHVKIVYVPGQPLSAKVYLRLDHKEMYHSKFLEWLQKGSAEFLLGSCMQGCHTTRG
jgi:hypothetical protein